MSRVIRASGGLVFRETSKGRVKILVAHRPGYDDWGLPKGKRDKGESDEQTALREVFEETGFRCRIVSPLPTTRHRANGSIKEVTWYAMRPLPTSPGFKENSEVDRIKWLAPKSAIKLVDYTTDEYLIATTNFKGLTSTGTLRLLRHGLAGARSAWEGDDLHRPLTKTGRKQAAAVAASLADSGIDRVVSSPYLRCIQTAEPVAKVAGARLEVDERLGEDLTPGTALEVVESLTGYNAVLSTHGEPIATSLKRLRKRGTKVDPRVKLAKASIWEIDVESGEFTTARYVAPPPIG